MSDDRPAERDDAKVLSYQTPGAPGRQWVSVWKPRNTVEANLAVAKLQEHGIHARVDMENAAGLAYAGVMYSKVQVLAEDADAARKLMLEIDQLRAQRQDAASVKCPNCGTPNPKRILHPLRWAALASFAAFGVSLGFEEKIAEHLFPVGWLGLLLLAGFIALIWGVTPRWRCKKCGQRWYAKEPEELDDDDDDDDDDGDRAGDRDEDEDEDEDVEDSRAQAEEDLRAPDQPGRA